MKSTPIFLVEPRDGLLVLTAVQDLGSLQYERLMAQSGELLELIESGRYRDLVIDLSRTDYIGSTALELFIRLWRRIRSYEGRLAICGASPHELEVLRTVKLDTLWSIHPSADEAVEALSA